MKKIIGMLIITSLIGGLGWLIYQRVTETRADFGADAQGANGGRGERNTAVAVEIVAVKQQTIQDLGEFTGSLFPQSQFIVTPKVGGQLQQLLVNLGDRVAHGQLIAKIDDEMARQQVDKALADLDIAKANLADAQSVLTTAARELARAKTLAQKDILSQSKLDAAQAAYDAAAAGQKVARATIKSRESSVASAKSNLAYTVIKAEWESGGDTRVVGAKFMDEGALLKANEPLVSLLDLSAIICVINVIERDYFRVQQGQPAIITTDAFPGETFTGQVARIAPMLDATSRQAQIEIDLPNPAERLKPGMFVRVQLQFADVPNATVVPIAALVTRDAQPGVFLADPQQLTAQFVPVTTGVTFQHLIQIVTPPLTGAVVTLGQHLLEDGSSILLSQPSAAADGDAPPTSTQRSRKRNAAQPAADAPAPKNQ